MNCKDCKHFKRWKKHKELVEQYTWGDCDALLDSPDSLDLWARDRDGEFVDFEANVHENFGCILFKEKEAEL